jgi:ParB-like chromosome segregation protein Spo0J
LFPAFGDPIVSAANSTASAPQRATVSTPRLESHPLAAIFPMMVGKKMDELVASIKKDGLQHPIVLAGDLIVDGRCRYEACRIAGIEPHFETYDEEDPAALVGFIQAANIHRRHMEPQQLAMIAAKLQKEAAKGPRGPFGKITLKKAAESVGASERSAKRAARVLENSPAEIVEAVERNEVPLTDAEAVTTAPQKQQKAALEKKRTGKSPSLRAAISGGTAFDPKELDAAPAAKKPANGKPTVPNNVRKNCKQLLQKLIRALNDAGIYNEFVTPLSSIAERLEQI